MLKCFTFATVAFVILPSQAMAAEVTFSGLVDESCTVSISTGGSLNTLSQDGTEYSSENLGTATVLLVSTSLSTTVQVSAPTIDQAPASAWDATAQIRYSSDAGTQPYTDGGTSFSLGLLTDTLLIDAKVVDSTGIGEGEYLVSTDVTCG